MTTRFSTRSREHGRTATLTETKPGVIGISNDFGFRDDLSPKVKDTLCEEEIHFSPYNAPELEAILERRAEGALREDASESSVLSLCAAIAHRTQEVRDRRSICCIRPANSRDQQTANKSVKMMSTQLETSSRT